MFGRIDLSEIDKHNYIMEGKQEKIWGGVEVKGPNLKAIYEIAIGEAPPYVGDDPVIEMYMDLTLASEGFRPRVVKDVSGK